MDVARVKYYTDYTQLSCVFEKKNTKLIIPHFLTICPIAFLQI
jgi:hypothetical protein